MSPRRWFAPTLTLLAGLALPALARAQDDASPDTAPLAPQVAHQPIVIRGETPDLRMELKLLSSDRYPGFGDRSEGVRCTGLCRLYVPPGEYRLRVIGSDGKSADRTIEIRDSEELRVGPIDRNRRNAGLLLGIIGTALIPVGMYLTLDGLASNLLDDPIGGVTIGLAVVGAGTALAAVGWVMFASGEFSLDRRELQGGTATARPRLALGAAALPGGAQLGATFNF